MTTYSFRVKLLTDLPFVEKLLIDLPFVEKLEILKHLITFIRIKYIKLQLTWKLLSF